MKKEQVKNLSGSLPYMRNFSRRNFFISSPVLRIALEFGAGVVERLDRSVNYALRLSPSLRQIPDCNKSYQISLD